MSICSRSNLVCCICLNYVVQVFYGCSPTRALGDALKARVYSSKIWPLYVLNHMVIHGVSVQSQYHLV